MEIMPMPQMILFVLSLILISHAEKAAHAGAGWPQDTCDCTVADTEPRPEAALD